MSADLQKQWNRRNHNGFLCILIVKVDMLGVLDVFALLLMLYAVSGRFCLDKHI